MRTWLALACIAIAGCAAPRYVEWTPAPSVLKYDKNTVKILIRPKSAGLDSQGCAKWGGRLANGECIGYQVGDTITDTSTIRELKSKISVNYQAFSKRVTVGPDSSKGERDTAKGGASERPAISEKGANAGTTDSAAEVSALSAYLEKLVKDPFPFYHSLHIQGLDRMQDSASVGKRNWQKLHLQYQEEYDAIASAKSNPRARYIGLALSGGGIRSASFALGVLKGLHDIKVLDSIGYLSSVSGGGFAAAWYMDHFDKLDPDSSRLESEGLFQDNSADMYHFAQHGRYISTGHYSHSLMDATTKTIHHFTFLPWHLLFNELFSYEINVSPYQLQYRHGIEKAFLYNDPISDSTGSIHEKLTMRRYLPSKENKRPFWIINEHLALTDDPVRFRNRSGDAFEVTPLRAGADAVGYIRVQDSISKDDNKLLWMTPQYAVPISGAAADASYEEMGPFSPLLNLLNLNLGYYILGWNWEFDSNKDFWWWHKIEYGISGAPIYNNYSVYHQRTSRSLKLYLTDGGHFENLGVYALVRRGCRLIIVSDGSGDPAASAWDAIDNASKATAFEDLRKLEHLLKMDFGAEIKMDWKSYHTGAKKLPLQEDLMSVLKTATGMSDAKAKSSALEIATAAAAAGVAAASAASKILGSSGTGASVNLAPRTDTASFAHSDSNRVFVGSIRNLPIRDDDGNPIDSVKIVYIKAAYSFDDGLRDASTFIDAVKALNPGFPSDGLQYQYFSEAKSIAYRTLGEKLVRANDSLFLKAISAISAPVKGSGRGEKPSGPLP